MYSWKDKDVGSTNWMAITGNGNRETGIGKDNGIYMSSNNKDEGHSKIQKWNGLQKICNETGRLHENDWKDFKRGIWKSIANRKQTGS